MFKLHKKDLELAGNYYKLSIKLQTAHQSLPAGDSGVCAITIGCSAVSDENDQN